MDEKNTVTIDVRQIPPPQRHPTVFQTFDSLTVGQSFTLINDHDPKPLYYQFLHEPSVKRLAIDVDYWGYLF